MIQKRNSPLYPCCGNALRENAQQIQRELLTVLRKHTVHDINDYDYKDTTKSQFPLPLLGNGLQVVISAREECH
jgi:hypothetical protein